MMGNHPQPIHGYGYDAPRQISRIRMGKPRRETRREHVNTSSSSDSEGDSVQAPPQWE
jgi:hypothetical protein